MQQDSMKGLRVARGLLYVVSVITLMVGFSVAFEGATEEERLLGSTFGVGMGLFGLVLTAVAFRTRDRLAWVALWYFPVFFAIHIAVVETWVPDAPLLVIAAGALLHSRRAFGARASAEHAVAA